MLYTRPGCDDSARARRLLAAAHVLAVERDVSTSERHAAECAALSGTSTTPQILIGDVLIDGYEDLVGLDLSRRLPRLVEHAKAREHDGGPAASGFAAAGLFLPGRDDFEVAARLRLEACARMHRVVAPALVVAARAIPPEPARVAVIALEDSARHPGFDWRRAWPGSAGRLDPHGSAIVDLCLAAARGPRLEPALATLFATARPGRQEEAARSAIGAALLAGSAAGKAIVDALIGPERTGIKEAFADVSRNADVAPETRPSGGEPVAVRDGSGPAVMRRMPAPVAVAFGELYAEIMGEDRGALSSEVKHLMARAAAIAARDATTALSEGYMAHVAAGETSLSVERARRCFDAAFDRDPPPLFSHAERAALKVAWLSARLPLSPSHHWLGPALRAFAVEDRMRIVEVCVLAAQLRAFVAVVRPDPEPAHRAFARDRDVTIDTLSLRYPETPLPRRKP